MSKTQTEKSELVIVFNQDELETLKSAMDLIPTNGHSEKLEELLSKLNNPLKAQTIVRGLPGEIKNIPLPQNSDPSKMKFLINGEL